MHKKSTFSIFEMLKCPHLEVGGVGVAVNYFAGTDHRKFGSYTLQIFTHIYVIFCFMSFIKTCALLHFSALDMDAWL